MRSRDYYVTILRFTVYTYVPASKEFHENVNYFWLETPDKTEQAIFGITWCVAHWRSKEVSGYYRMIVKNGDVEVFGYAQQILLDKLYQEKQKEFIQNGYDLVLKQ